MTEPLSGKPAATGGANAVTVTEARTALRLPRATAPAHRDDTARELRQRGARGG